MMKNLLRIFLVATTVLWVACSDSKDGWDSDSRELTISKLTVVTAVRGDTAIAEATSNFFVDEDVVEFRYKHAGLSPVDFTCEMTNNGWSDLSKALYYSYIYSKELELESFTAEFGNPTLVTDQSTEEKYHASHHLIGDAYIKDRTTVIRVDSMINQHVKVIVKIQKSAKWAGGSEFSAVMNKDAVVIHTATGGNILPFYSDTLDNYAIYSAILPEEMVPAEGNPAFTIKGKAPLSYDMVSGSDSPKSGQTLLITARYDNVNTPTPIALTKNVWDTFVGTMYGYPVIEEIYSLNDLDMFAASVSSGVDYTGKKVYLMNDLNLENEGINPIGTRNHPFNGTFYGDGKTVSNVAIHTETIHTGFFGSIGVSGTVRDLTITDARIESEKSYAAVLAGSNYGYIVACSTSDCEVTGYDYVASMVGYNEGTVVGCDVQNDALYTLRSTDATAGGVVGYNYKRVVACKSNPTTVQVTRTSGNKFGAIVGEAPISATIDRCSWTHAKLPALGAGGYNKPINNSTTAEMNQAISNYNTALASGSEQRTCPQVW